MRKTARSIVLALLTLVSAVALGVVSTMSAGFSLAAATTVTALIMGGSGTPDPDQEVGYVPNVSSYYIFPNSACQIDNCKLQSVVTPEEAWPLYGGLTALTWKQSILEGLEIYDAAVRTQLQTADTKVVMFGYSQSGAIVAIEKRALASDPTIPQSLIDKLQLVVIGNPSRPNGGLNVRLPLTIPIVEFPFGPPMPTDTTIETTDIALKWDIMADAPLYALNGLAMLNALIGGPGFGIVHGTYPNPEGEPPTGLVGGYTQEEWQEIMDNPDAFATAYPDVVNVQKFGDTKYITVTPKVLPLLVPLHTLGLGFVADLVEPALRVIIEETGYDRSIPYGQPTPFQLVPVFDPIKLAIDVIAAIPEGITQALNGGRPPLTLPGTETTSAMSMSSASVDPPATVDLSKDGTTAPDSGSATSNGAGTTQQKTEVETASGTNATQSNATEVKQVDPTEQDLTKDSEEIKKDPEEAKKDPEESKKDPERKKDPDVGKKDADETKKNGSGVSVSLNFSPKKPADGDTGGDTASKNDDAGTTSPEGTESEQAAA
jgi:hypothetical protein